MFNIKNAYEVVSERQEGPFTIEFAWAPEYAQLELMFDPEADYFDELVEKLADGTWTHFIARVRVLHDGKEMGVDYLGSCIAEDPAEWFEKNPDGYVEDMINTAREEAQTYVKKMLEDFKFSG